MIFTSQIIRNMKSWLLAKALWYTGDKFDSNMQYARTGEDWLVGQFGGGCTKGQLQQVEKMLTSEYVELLSVNMKELKLRLGICQKFASFFNYSAYGVFLWSLLVFMYCQLCSEGLTIRVEERF